MRVPMMRATCALIVLIAESRSNMLIPPTARENPRASGTHRVRPDPPRFAPPAPAGTLDCG